MGSRLATSLIAGSLVAGVLLALRAAGALQGLELAVYDRLVQRAERLPSSVTLILVTEEDIRAQGHWPISDRTLAEALLALQRGGVLAIGLDLYRDLPVTPGTELFRRVLAENPQIIAVRKFGALDGEGIAGPAVLEGTNRVGFNDLPLDPDQKIRRALLYQDDGVGEVQTSFSLRLALAVLTREGIVPRPDPIEPNWIRLGAVTIPPLEPGYGGYVDLDAAGYQFLLDYRATRFPRFHLGELLSGEIPASSLEGRIVLIGSRAKSLPDMRAVPIGDAIAGVEVHAHILDQLLRLARGASSPVRVPSDAAEVAAVLLLAVLGAALGTGVGRSSVGGAGILVAAGLGGGALLWAAGAVAYRLDWWLPLVAPGLTWFAGLGLSNAWVSSRERAVHAQLLRVFERSVSPAVADEIWRDREKLFSEGRLRPQRLRETVLFADMKGYTGSSEKMDPALLMEWVNDFMQAMTQQVEAHGGLVDDYFGDGLKANFGVPIPRQAPEAIAEDARNAVRCALAMQGELTSVNRRYRNEGLPEVALRIGIHSGEVVAGSLGGAQRIKYTTVGDVVVTGQRLEATDAVTHDFARAPVRILVSEATLQLLGGSFETESMGEIPLKGREHGVRVHRVLGERRPE